MSFPELDPKTLEIWKDPPKEWVDLMYHLDGFVPEEFVRAGFRELEREILRALYITDKDS